jgi:hypothetical protein
MNQQRSAPSAALSQAAVDSIKAEVERSVYDSVRRMLAGRPSFILNTPGLGTPRLPGTPNPPVNPEGRRVLRIAVQDVLDGSRDKSLGGLASALTDSLRKIAGRRPATDLLSLDKVRTASSPRGNPEAIARELGADVLLRGIVEIRGDSARFTVVLHDVNAGQFSKSLRAAAPIADAASIMDPVSGPLTGWLDQRRPGGRTAQIYNIGPGGAVDSALRYARQLRDSVAKSRGRKPDSIPPRPQPTA